MDPQLRHRMDTALAREHAAEAIARGREWDCDCFICGQLRAAGWRPELDQGAYPFVEQVIAHVAGIAHNAALNLWMRRGTQAARMALDVATAAVSALASPHDPKLAAAVDRMYLAFIDVDNKRGDRQVVVEVERAVMAVLATDAAYAVPRLRGDLVSLVERHKVQRAVPDDATLARVLAECEVKFAARVKKSNPARAQTSGAIAGILHAMRWFGADPPETLEAVTQRVSEAQRARRIRTGEHVPKPKKKATKKRAKRIESKKKP